MIMVIGIVMIRRVGHLIGHDHHDWGRLGMGVDALEGPAYWFPMHIKPLQARLEPEISSSGFIIVCLPIETSTTINHPPHPFLSLLGT